MSMSSELWKAPQRASTVDWFVAAVGALPVSTASARMLSDLDHIENISARPFEVVELTLSAVSSLHDREEKERFFGALVGSERHNHPNTALSHASAIVDACVGILCDEGKFSIVSSGICEGGEAVPLEMLSEDDASEWRAITSGALLNEDYDRMMPGHGIAPSLFRTMAESMSAKELRACSDSLYRDYLRGR